MLALDLLGDGGYAEPPDPRDFLIACALVGLVVLFALASSLTFG